MKTFFLFFTSLVCLSFSTEEKGIPINECVLERSVKDNSLKPEEAIFKFTFINILDVKAEKVITYSIDGAEGKEKLNDNSSLEFKTTPGKHIFQFYFNENYMEVYTDSLNIKAQHRDDYLVNFYSVNLSPELEFIMVDKPVIYLYPESEIGVEVKLDIKGNTTFMYPAYNESWKFKAQPDGTLTFGKKTFNYLFWEASQAVALTPKEIESGFVFEGANAADFLEEKLTLAGLTSMEKADFITFWGPQMVKYEGIYLRFEFNESCDKYAELNITPKPDNLYRIYIVWSPVNTLFDVKEQEIVPINRTGFTVLEWGGREETITIPKHLIH